MKKQKQVESKKVESLGFLFGFKETEKTADNTFTVKFKSGSSKKFPSKYQKFKDFWATEIFAGQTSEIYINPTKFKEYVNIELKEVEQDKSFFEEQYRNRRYYFDYDITFNQYAALNSFSMAHLHVNLYERWENDKVLSEVLDSTIGKEFKNDKRSMLEIYEDYKKVSDYIYNKEIAQSLGELEVEHDKPKKPKMK